MELFVVIAQYCEDSVICGVATDRATADLIIACEKSQDGIKPDSVWCEEYDNIDYLPLKNGLHPYEVQVFADKIEVVAAGLEGFVCDRVYNSMRNGKKCRICEVYARDKEHALAVATNVLKDCDK